MRQISALMSVLLCTSCFGGWNRFTADRDHGFAARTAVDQVFYVYTPKENPPGTGWPVVLFLHGGGESGRDPVRPTQVGLGWTVFKSEGRFPFVVVFPQCPRATDWTSARGEARALTALDDVLANLPVDPKRVYLVGNSMGAHGSLLLAARQSSRFAAVIAVAGRAGPSRWFPTPPDARVLPRGYEHETLAQQLVGTPVWLVHGKEDAVTPADESMRLAAAMQALGAEIRLTLYDDAGHAAAWERAYEDPAIFTWLLKHTR